MGYVLLWLENLAALLILATLLFACLAHLHRGPLRSLLTALTIFLPALFFASLVGVIAIIESNNQVHIGWFWPIALLGMAYVVGALAIWLRGGRTAPGTETAAATWPRDKLALVLGVVLLLHAMTFLNLDEAVKQSLGEVRAEATARALSVAPQRVPDHENAALVYQKVFDSLDKGYRTAAKSEWAQVWRDVNESRDFDYNSPQLAKFLADRAGELALLEAAAAKPGCYFERDYGRPTVDMLLPEMQDLRECARLLAVHARYAAAQGNLKAALTDVNALFAMARHAGTEPILVSMLVSVAIQNIGEETLQTILQSVHPTSDDLATIDIDRGTSYRKLMRRTMLLEEAFILNLFASLDTVAAEQLAMALAMKNEPNPFFRPALPFYRVFLLSDDLAGYRRLMHEGEQGMSEETYADTKTRLARLDQEIAGERPSILTRLLVPSIASANEAAVRADALQAVAVAGLAMHRYWAKTGKFADSLQELSPTVIALVPRDPYDGKPLKLKKTGDGWIVYSVGPDLKDEEGLKFDDKDRRGDLGFEFTAPTKSDAPK